MDICVEDEDGVQYVWANVEPDLLEKIHILIGRSPDTIKP